MKRPIVICCFYISQMYTWYDYLREIQFKKAKIKAKKKPRRRSDSSGGYTLSDIIQSPPAAGTQQHTEGLFGGCLIFSFFISVHCGNKAIFPLVSDLSNHGEVREGEL